MKIVFLDFDGVMDTGYYDHILSKKGLAGNDEFGTVFDPNCVQNLKHIIDDLDGSNFNPHQINKLLVVNPYNGIDEATAEKAIQLLNNQV